METERINCKRKDFQNPESAPWAVGGAAFASILTGEDGAGGFEILCDDDGEILYQLG